MEHYNLLPADIYIVYNKTILNNEDRKILNMLYQPILGPLPIMLYFSLWSDLDKSEIISNEYNHHHLEANMHMSLSEISSARLKLEATGLLRTLVKEDNTTSYIYELYSPLSANEFFNHPILNIVLYSNVGKKEYDNLVNYFKIPRINTNGYTDISASFSTVFGSVPMTSYEAINDSIRKYNKLKLDINTNFDFDFLVASMPNTVNKERLFTKENKELILELSFLYEIDAMKMQNIIKGCLNERGTISKDDLRKACRNYYQFDNGGLLPSLIDTTQPNYLRKPIGDTSKRAKMIYTFESISPYDLLKSKNGGAEPTKRDLRLAEDLIIDYKLKPGVVNVLIDYTLKTNNNKLNRNFVETIAGQWQRLKIETVDEAMSLAEKEHKKYNKTTKIKKETIKEEKIPDWFDKNIEDAQATTLEKRRIEELLKEYK
jgi:replication initiation and membrane attachment protein